MNATMNTFPPFQSMGSPRGWILAVIVLLHFGFFLVLSSGLMPDVFAAKEHRSDVFVIDSPEEIIERPPPPTYVPTRELPPLYVPAPDVPIPTHEEAPQRAPQGPTTDVLPPSDTAAGTLVRQPVMTQPEIDPRRPLSEPMYPSRAIREEWAGTVLLSVYVLENGRVGEVRLDRSSGYSELDVSAVREAKRWRLKPGMRDGIAVPMWKQIPITFQLKGDL